MVNTDRYGSHGLWKVFGLDGDGSPCGEEGIAGGRTDKAAMFGTVQGVDKDESWYSELLNRYEGLVKQVPMRKLYLFQYL